MMNQRAMSNRMLDVIEVGMSVVAAAIAVYYCL